MLMIFMKDAVFQLVMSMTLSTLSENTPCHTLQLQSLRETYEENYKLNTCSVKAKFPVFRGYAECFFLISWSENPYVSTISDDNDV